VLYSYILDEPRRVLPSLVHRHGPSAGEIDDLVDTLSIRAEIIEPVPGSDPALIDAGASRLGTRLAAMQAAGVNDLITGAPDLLALADRYPELTLAGFWAVRGGP